MDVRIIDDINTTISQTTNKILSNHEMIYPDDNKYKQFRKTVLTAMGDRHLQYELKQILVSHGMEGNIDERRRAAEN